jgi:hypothetical protein
MKKPYTKEEFAAVVARGEARLGTQHFFSPVVAVKTVEVVQVVEQFAHAADCTCTVCFHVKLDALVAKTQENLDILQGSLNPVPVKQVEAFDDIQYIG